MTRFLRQVEQLRADGRKVEWRYEGGAMSGTWIGGGGRA